MKKLSWTVSVGGTEMSFPISYNVKGTEKQVKKFLVSLVKRDREHFKKETGVDRWVKGAESVDGIYMHADCPCAVALYTNFERRYIARPEQETYSLKNLQFNEVFGL